MTNLFKFTVAAKPHFKCGVHSPDTIGMSRNKTFPISDNLTGFTLLEHFEV